MFPAYSHRPKPLALFLIPPGNAETQAARSTELSERRGRFIMVYQSISLSSTVVVPNEKRNDGYASRLIYDRVVEI